MRHFKLIMIMFLSFMMVPNIVFAEGSSIKLEAPTTASKDDEILVNINLETDVPVNEFKANKLDKVNTGMVKTNSVNKIITQNKINNDNNKENNKENEKECNEDSDEDSGDSFGLDDNNSD